MPITSLFYKYQTTSTPNHTYTPTGVLDVNQIVRNKKPWILPTMKKLEPKKLVLADWTAFNWSKDKITSVQTALTQLIDQGFTLYINQSGEIKPLGKADLSTLQQTSTREVMVPAFSDDLINSTIAQHRLTRDEVFILDDYWLNHLLNEDNTPMPRSLHLNDFVALNQDKQKQDKLINILKHAEEPLRHIIFDTLSSDGIKVLSKLQSEFPDTSTESDYHYLVLISALFELFGTKSVSLHDQELTIEGMIINLKQLETIQHLDVLNNKLAGTNINTILASTPHLKTLNFKNYQNSEGLSLPFESLSELRRLEIDSTCMSNESIQSLLDATPALNELTLDASNIRCDNISLAAKSRPQLEKISLSSCGTSAESVKVLLAAAPSLKKFDLFYCPGVRSSFIDESIPLLSLEELRLASVFLSAENLQILLTSTPVLKELFLQTAKDLEGSITLKPSSLIHLEKLYLRNTNITSHNIQVILAASPNIKKLQLEYCDNIQDSLNITEQFLELEEITLAYQDVSAEFLSALLIAAPNLKKLNVSACNITGGNLIIDPKYLAHLNQVNLTGTTISAQDLSTLLSASPEISDLNLLQSNIINGDVSIAPNSLSHLDNINLNRSTISSPSLSNLLAALPGLKKINLSNCTKLDGTLSINPESLSQVEEIDLSGSTISAPELSNLLNATSALKKINLYQCSKLDGIVTIAPQCLSHLEEINLSGSTISTQSLSNILNEASALKKLHLFFPNLNGTISIAPKSNPQLEFISMRDGSSQGLSALLNAAPNVKHLILINCERLTDTMEIGPESLTQLSEINLSTNTITTKTLETILYAASALKNLSLNNCKNIVGNLALAPNALAQLEGLNLAQSKMSIQFFETLLAASSSSLKTLDVQASILHGDLKTAPNSLINLEYIYAQNSSITIQQVKALLAAAPNLKILNLNSVSSIKADDIKKLSSLYPNIELLSNQFDMKLFKSPTDHSNTFQPVDSSHNAESFKDLKPTPKDFEFEFKGQNKTKNQGMIIEKFCQYLTLKQKHLPIIPKLQDGICNALSHLFIDVTSKEWSNFIGAIATWNGKDTPSPELTKHFERLWIYIQNHQLKGTTGRLQYLGTNLPDFLAKNKTCILNNPWHAITIKFLSNGKWSVYDPNFVDGAREVNKTDLINTIHDAIGSVVSVELKTACSPGIANPDDFIEHGGLLALVHSANAKEMMAALPKTYHFSAAALDGLLLRDLRGTPAWVLALNNPLTAALTQQLLQQFKNVNPDTFQKQLQKSMEAMSALTKREVITQLVQSEPTVNQPKTEQAPSESFNKSLITLIRSAPPTNNYEQRLKTWLKPRAKAGSLLEYTQHCLRSDAPKKRLIELSSTAEVDALHFALKNHAKNTQRPLYYIHSPDDLVCSAPYIERKGNIGLMKKGPGGPLHDFLTADRDPNAPVLVVNYENFAADDIVRLNALIDKERLADGTPLPEQALVIGLLNKSKPECYTGSDFYSRFNQVETCPLSSKQLEPAIPQLPIVAIEELTEEPFVINLFNSNQWKEILLGYWVLDGNNLIFHEGELAKAKGQAITIQNGLWDNKEFHRFWLEKTENTGGSITVPAPIQLVRTEGYDWNQLQSLVHFADSSSSLDAPIAINPYRLNECFSRYTYQDTDKSITKLPGLIEEARGNVLNLHITRTLNEDDWARVLTECQHHNVTLNVFCAPEVVLPSALQKYGVATTPTSAPWDGQEPSADKIIISTDVDTTVAMLTEDQNKDSNSWQVIDVTECTPTDLLLKLDATLDKGSLKFIFDQREGALLKGLAANKRILLKGLFSAELADHLAPLLLERQRASKNTGQLVIVSQQQDLFQCLPCDNHEVSEEKNACLGALSEELANKLTPFLATESLSQVIARRDFWLAFPDKASSDDAWIGMHHLPDRLQPLAPLDPIISEQLARDFTIARQYVVNSALERAPYVLLTGLTGVGKSTFVSKHLAREEDSLHQGESKLKAWAEDTKTVGRKILFIDEATLSSRDWSEFEGLFPNPPGILVDGTFYRLTPEHKVVFAGNPVSYGDERQLATFFKRHGNAILFEPLPTAMLHHDIIKPVFANRSLEPQTFALSAHFLDVYRFLVDCSTTEVLVTPRELQMMALLTQSYCSKNPDANAEEVARYYAYSLVHHLVPQNRKPDFDALYKPVQPLQRPVPESARYTLTPSRLPMRALLDDLLLLRESRQQPGNEEQQYGGLGGLIIDGEPGVGKSELVIETLLAHHFEEMHDFELPATAEKPFYRMPVSMSLPEKERLLRKAFDEGAVVIIDEINSSPMIERLLNELLMGKTPEGNRPQKPGFMIIGTQNPVTMAGRRAPSTALSRRMITNELPPYPDAEMRIILMNKGISKEDAKGMIVAYNKNLNYARANRLEPIPCFRDLSELADEVLRGHNASASNAALNLVDDEDLDVIAILARLKFDNRLDLIEEKIIKFEGNEEARATAKTLHEALVLAKNTFINSGDPITKKLPVFKQDCLDAIGNSREILTQHRGWKIILSGLINTLVSILTLGEPDSEKGKKLFSFFPDIRTDSVKKLDDLQDDIEQASKTHSPPRSC